MPPFIVCELRRGGRGGAGVKVFGGRGGISEGRGIRGGRGGGRLWLSSSSTGCAGVTSVTNKITTLSLFCVGRYFSGTR